MNVWLAVLLVVAIGLLVWAGISIRALQRTVSDLRKAAFRLRKENALKDKKLQSQEIDATTGILRRDPWEEHVKRKSVRVEQGLLYFDLDGFKGVNDTFGHPVGDDILRIVARCITENTRSEFDFVCRLGGDEYAVALDMQHFGNSADYEAVLKRIAAKIRRSLYVHLASREEYKDSKEIQALGFSAGFALLETEGDLTAALAEADSKMYENKRRRKTDQKTALALNES